MKKYISFILTFSLILLTLTGCSSKEYNTSGQLSIGISADLPVYSYNTMSSSFAVISHDAALNITGFTETNSAVLINDSSKEALVAYNAHQQIYPASMTKIMTAILVFEALEEGTISLEDEYTLEETVTFSESGVAASDLTGGCTVTVKNLLYALLIRSYNDCAILLGRIVAGDETTFVSMMNAKAAELGATNTSFMNPHGLHNENHYTTAYDLYLIFSEFCTYDMAYIIDATTEYDFTYTDANGQEQVKTITATNGYLSGEYNCPEGFTIGSWKTGTTNAAGNCVIIEFVNDTTGNKYIAVITGADGREALYTTMSNLMTYAK